jgi:hypothetical protein
VPDALTYNPLNVLIHTVPAHNQRLDLAHQVQCPGIRTCQTRTRTRTPLLARRGCFIPSICTSQSRRSIIAMLYPFSLAFLAVLVNVKAQRPESENITISSLPTFSTCQPAQIDWRGGSCMSPFHLTVRGTYLSSLSGIYLSRGMDQFDRLAVCPLQRWGPS